MKRSLIFCAIALVAVAVNTASAAVDVQLNLRYDDPNNEAAGGSWDLLVKSDGAGVAGISVLIDGILDVDSSADGTTGFNVFEAETIGTVTEIVTGFDLASPATDVGLGAGTTGAVADDLFPGNSPTWDNSAWVASGLFGATRPSFVSADNDRNEGVNEFSGTTAVETTFGTQSVRGDSVATDGLIIGDLNRDGQVAGADLLSLLPNLGTPGGWDDGDFGSDSQVAGSDLLALLPNLGTSAAAPSVAAVTAVPEPASIAMLAIAASLSMGMRRRRK